ncbi:TonB-dependent receptor plug domain-containing protein [Steroidobacter sp. S1-65]|uniref:TonB-dependent receptor plug domain-containing protein n=1 Tax=Steroidobacter gossypii TaxID=2805490 RepID=A0ABS1X6L5_9GAMM|nr:TonB-dependent receptor plug domain-containing protein [Steroidobacter gossypii]MBM0108867.1 TonB-dependent receptor plug domain-containing protein [Steroidobacter gossypii]
MRSASVGVLLLSVVGFSFAADSWAAIKRSTHIRAQELGSALETLAREHGFQVLYRTEIVDTLRSRPVEGELSTDEALRRLLNGTGLTYRVLGDKAITIVPLMEAAPAGATSSLPASPMRVSQLAFQAVSDAQQIRGSDAPGTRSASSGLEEIVVTATKRKERLRDLAGAASATSGVQLAAIGAQSNADYLGRLPGVVFNEGTSGQSTVTIRGIGTTAGVDQGQGPTGYFINEVPLSEPSYASGIPDIDTFDLDRVEVLRGPQGTLFGSSSLGGAVNYIVKTADPAQLEAGTETTVRSIDHSGGDLSYTAKAMLSSVSARIPRNGCQSS